MITGGTAADLNAGDPPHEIGHRFDHGRHWRRLVQQGAAGRQLRRLVLTRHQTMVTNALETGRQHMR